MLWAIVGIGVLICIAIAIAIWAAFAIAGRADDQLEEWLNNRDDEPYEPRCDMTGRRLTARERFERDCG